MPTGSDGRLVLRRTLLTEFVSHRLNVARLIDGNGARHSVMANLEVQEPLEFTHVRDIKELVDVRFECPGSVSTVGANGYIIR